MIFDVGFNARMGFSDAAKLPFPAAVENRPIDVASARICFVAIGLGSGEIDLSRRSDRVVGVKHGFDWTAADLRPRDRSRDSLAGHVGQHLVQELSGAGAALADEATVEPLLGDALELSEEIEPWFLARITPLGFEQPFG